MNDVLNVPRHRETAPSVHWFTWCLEARAYDEDIHAHASSFLIVGDRESVLFDTSVAKNSSWLVAELDVLLAGRPLDWVVPTHLEVAHAGGLAAILDHYPGSRVVGPVTDYELSFDLDGRTRRLDSGERIDLGGGYEFTVLSSPVPTSVWGYERRTRTLFTGDGFPMTHRPPREPSGDVSGPTGPEECDLIWSELSQRPSVEGGLWCSQANMYWARYMDAGIYMERLRDVLRRYPTRLVAPSHGAPIDDVEAGLAYVDDIAAAHRKEFLRSQPPLTS